MIGPSIFTQEYLIAAVIDFRSGKCNKDRKKQKTEGWKYGRGGSKGSDEELWSSRQWFVAQSMDGNHYYQPCDLTT
jgi:hypothetical protein